MTKKTKKKIIYLLHVACHFTKEHQKKTSNENNVSEKQLKLTHAIKKQMKWEIILLKNSFFFI